VRRLLVLAVLVALATLLWLRLRPHPQPPAPVSLVQYENVLAALADGEVVRTTVALDAGTLRGQAQTVEVDRREGARATGLLSRPDGDPPYAWLVGERPSFTLDVLQPIDRELLVELVNGTEGSQSVELLFNGTAIAHQDLPPAPEPCSVTVPVPAALQRRGPNHVELHFAQTQTRSLEKEPPLPMAAILRHVAFSAPGRTRDPLPPPPPAGLVERSVDGERRNSLLLPPETVARAAVRLPAAPRIVLRFVVQELHAPLELAVQLDDKRAPLHVFQPGGPSPDVAEFDLTPWAGQTVVLEFWARESRDAGLVGARLGDANVLVPADWVEPRPVATPSPPVGSRPSFLVVVLDAFARRYEGASVNGSLVTPALEGVADHALLFEDATTPASYTLASIGSLLTGQFPLTHGVMALESSPGVTSRLAPDAPRLAVELRARGWRTAAFVTNPNAAAMHGYGEGFDRFDELWADKQLWLPQGGVSGDVLPARFADFLQSVGDQPYLAYVHVFEPHAPYEAPADLTARFVKPYQGPVDGSRAWIDAFKSGATSTDEAGWTHLRELYAARAALADRILARLLVALVKSGRDADTVVVVLGDHGESLGEHGLVEHGDDVPHEQLDVPLLMAVPGLGKGRRSGPASVADIAPTLLKLAGLTPPDSMQGTDLLTGALDVHRPLPAVSSVYLPELSWTHDGQRLVVNLLTRRVQLFDESVDRGDAHDLSEERPATRLMLLRELCRDTCAAETARAARTDGTAGTPLDPSVAARINSIGYTGKGASGPAPPLRLTAELRRLLIRL
jgi:arylsulfatase A-like enzyme